MLLSAQGSVLLLLDLQERLIHAIDDGAVAIDRARQRGAEIVTSEMVLFEWLRDARHPRFREVHRLLK